MTPAKAKIMTRSMATSTEFEFASWSAPQAAWTIEYPLEVMDEIRAYACNELLQLSHGGAEVAGVMFGSQRSGVIRILTWRPIASEYTEGNTLKLSHRDRMNLAVQLEVARGNPELKDLRPLGWFVSHPNGEVSMTSSDLEVYSGFFPESSQMTFVIRPTERGCAEAGFFMREADGSVRSDASYQNIMLEPLHSKPTPANDREEPASQEARALESNGVLPNVPTPSPAAPSLDAPNLTNPRFATPRFTPPSFAAPSPAAPRLAAPSVSPPDQSDPIFDIEEPVPTRERWLWAIPIALALGLAAWSLYHRQKPVETSPLAFRISSNAARTVQLEWNPKSPALRDAEHGEIDITDDGKTTQVPLSSNQLHSGRMAYIRQSNDVGFQLNAYPESRAPVHETARLIAPASSASTQPPQLLPSEDEAAQRKVLQLTEELRKERARTLELENLNRILMNRLGIQPDPPKPAPQP
jgi:JAB1/Mov34/MPN/PAD-1 ubiquitin protease